MDTNSYLIKRSVSTHIAVAILVSLTATASTVINGLITGRNLGPDALVAFGLASPIFILLGAVAGIFSNGGTICCSKHIGRGDGRAVANNFTTVTMATVAVGIAFSLVSVIFCDQIASLFGAKGSICSMTSDYIRAIGISTVPFLVLQNQLLYLRVDNDQRLALIIMCITIGASTVFAVWGSTSGGLGLFGIGLSIGVGNLLGTAVSLLHFRKRDHMLSFCRISGMKGELRDIISSGMPTAINRGSQTLKNLILNSFLLSFGGTAAVLSLSVQTNVYQFLIAISTGYGLVTSMMCGIFVGEKDRRAVCDTLKATMVSGFIVSCIAGAALFLLSDQIASLFVTGGDVEAASKCLKLFAFSQPTSTVCLIFLYMYQTLGDLLLSTAVSVTRGVVYVVAFSILLAPVMGLDGVWISFMLADVLSIVTIIAAIAVRNKRFPMRIADLVTSKKCDFSCNIVCDISVRNDPGEIDGLADRIAALCISAGVPREKTDRVALCIEEMAGNVMDHAYRDSKEHYIDIRVIRSGDDVIFRMRDDGIPFNPMTYESGCHLGIRVVRSVAKSIDYRYSIKLNNLSVMV